LFELLLAYWPVLLLLYAPRLAQLISVVIAERTQSTLDHRIPDEMPKTAGEWLERELLRLRIGVRAVVTDQHTDAYRPRDKIIQLRDTTSFKADPVYWATAAHELGHAHNRVRFPLVGALRTLSVLLTIPLLAAGVALVAGHVLYAIPVAGTLAFACFAIAAALPVFVLVDEALASIYAYRRLRVEGAAHVRPIRAVLVTAFATYFVTHASYALLLTQWSLLETLAHPVQHATLTTLGWIFAVVLAAASAAAFVLKDGALRWVPITLLVLLVWDVVDPAYAWCVIAALAASWRVWYRVAHLPAALPYGLVAMFAKRFEGPGVEQTTRFLVKRDLGRRAIESGNAMIEHLRARWRDSTWHHVASWTRLGYLPLLVVIWL
jgi:Zn-dependent membrane protease YugP